MSVQIKRRRDTVANNNTFTGAQGEIVIDTTYTRPRVHDGSTVGGFPLGLEGRTPISDTAYSVLGTDRLVSYTTLTAARIITLPAASAYPIGARLTIADESGSCSATNALTINRAGSDTINGTTSTVVSTPYGSVSIESNGSNAWTILSNRAVSTSRTAIADAAYAVLPTDRDIAYTSLTTARTVTLCAASAYPQGTELIIHDESGSCAAGAPIVVNRAGSDTILGKTSTSISIPYGYIKFRSNGASQWDVTGRSMSVQSFASSSTYTPTPGMVYCDVFCIGAGGGGGGGALQAASTLVSGAGGGGGGAQTGPIRLTAVQVGASQTVTIGAGGTAGVAATSTTTAGGNGGAGGATSFGTLARAWGGGGGGGGQLGATTSGGGGGAGSSGTAASSTGITGGAGGGLGGGTGGTGAVGGLPTVASSGTGGAGCAATGIPPAVNNSAFFGGGGGGAGGGITAGNAAQTGGAGSSTLALGIAPLAGGAGGAANTIGGAGTASTLLFSLAAGSGGGGGGAGTSGTAGNGGVGGVAGGGGGGGGSMTNGGTAGTGGVGGVGSVFVAEYF